jgi:hypothetical protein
VGPHLPPATRKAAELIDDMVRLEAAKGFLTKSALIDRLTALPSLQKPEDHRSFIRLSTAERIRCVARLERGLERPLQNHLCADPDAVIAGWRRMIVAAGGTTPVLEPLLRRLASRTGRRKNGALAADLGSLLSAYGAVRARKEFRKRNGSGA